MQEAYTKPSKELEPTNFALSVTLLTHLRLEAQVEIVFQILIQTLLANVKDEFLETAGYTLDKGIKKGFRGDAKELLRAVVRGNGHGVGKY